MTQPLSPSRRARMIGIGLAVAVLLGTTAAILTNSAFRDDGNGDMTIVALFPDASPLVPGNVVRAAGVDVGSINSISLQNGLARVQMTVKKAALPLHQDARAIITEQDLLGERYISLTRGTPSAPLLTGNPLTIPAAQTGSSIDLQSILNGVNDPTGAALAELVTTLGEGVSGHGPNIAAGITALEPAVRQAGDLAQLLSQQNTVLTQLVDSAQPVASALAVDNGAKLDNLVGAADQTLSTAAVNSDAMQAALQRLPHTLASAQHALAQVAGVADRTTPTLAAIRPTTDNLKNISGELEQFSDAADPALASLTPVLTRGRDMLDEAAPVVSALRHGGGGLRQTAAGARPIMEKAFSGRLVNLMQFVKQWSLSTADYDGLSNYFRAYVSLSPKSDGQVAAGLIPGAPEAPVPSVAFPNLGVPPPFGPAHEQLSQANPGRTTPPIKRQGPAYPGSHPDGQSATGLSKGQENNMLGQLLGGH